MQLQKKKKKKKITSIYKHGKQFCCYHLICVTFTKAQKFLLIIAISETFFHFEKRRKQLS